MVKPRNYHCSVPVPEGLDVRALRFLLSPRLDDIPLPKAVFRDEAWPTIIEEIADHIGDAEALRIADVFANGQIYIPSDPSNSPFRGVISEKSVEKMAFVFGRERLQLPSDAIVRRIKKHLVISSVRAGKINVSSGAVISQTPRRHFSNNVHQTDEWKEYAPADVPEPRIIVALRRASEIAGEALTARGAPGTEVQTVTNRIMGLWFDYRFPKREEDDEHSGE